MPPTIHPTSIVDPQAQLADDVTVGPWCRVEGPVTLGPATRLIASAHLVGPLSLGQGNTVYPFTCLGMAPQDRKYGPDHPGAGLVIGDQNIFRESVTIHRATGEEPTTIGDRNYFMANSHVGHDCIVHDDTMLANGSFLGGHVELANGAIIGGTGGVHQFCRIGRLAIVSGLAGVTGDVIPFGIVYNTRELGGINIVGLRRAGLREHIPALKHAYRILFEQGHANQAAANQILTELGDDPLCAELARFVLSAKRALTVPPKPKD